MSDENKTYTQIELLAILKQKEIEHKELLRIARSNAKKKKEFSIYFRNQNSLTAKKIESLSETARHIESNNEELLILMKKELNINVENFLTVRDFHLVVEKALIKYYS